MHTDITPKKFTPVSFINLPKQDYAKVKKLWEMLQPYEFATVNINDIEDFRYFCTLISTKPYYLIVKPALNNLWTVCKLKN